MKKKVLLILMFITMFVIGNRNVYALTCKIGEKGCTIEAIEEELGPNNKLVCAYKVKFSYDEYYTYIYYDEVLSAKKQKDMFYAGATKFTSNYIIVDSIADAYSSKHAVVGNAYKNLTENHQCPSNSHMIYWSNTMNVSNCFDDASDNKCSETNNYGSLYNTTSENVLDNMSELKYIDEGIINTDDANDCVYIDVKNADIINFNINDNEIIWSEMETGKRYTVSAGKENAYSAKKNFKTTSVFTNNLTSQYNSCPKNIYLFYQATYAAAQGMTSEVYDFYDSKSSDIIENYGKNGALEIREYMLKENSYNPGITPSSDDCSLLSEEILSMINNVMNIIRIAIPLLLIGLITYDFAMATFANDDKAMNKAKQNVIKRIIIAIIIFFVPTLINLVFNVVNEVWANTHLEICGLDKE